MQLSELAEGMYIIQYTKGTDSSGKLIEFCARVSSISKVADDSIIDLIGFKTSAYSNTAALHQSKISVNEEVVKFNPITQYEALAWLSHYGVEKQIVTALTQAEASIKNNQEAMKVFMEMSSTLASIAYAPNRPAPAEENLDHI